MNDIELGEIGNFLEQHKLFISRVREFFKDKEIPLNKRWNIYLKLENFLPSKPCECSLGHIEIDDNKFSLYSDFGIDRYEIVKYSNIVEIVEEEQDSGKWSQLDLTLIKEKILENGFGEFENDW